MPFEFFQQELFSDLSFRGQIPPPQSILPETDFQPVTGTGITGQMIGIPIVNTVIEEREVNETSSADIVISPTAETRPESDLTSMLSQQIENLAASITQGQSRQITSQIDPLILIAGTGLVGSFVVLAFIRGLK